MSPRKPAPTAADYLVIAISPALIMLLVGSLVFFLLTAFYQTEFEGRLKYISALFVFSAVLITRVSIVEGSERAAILSVPLALATWVTLAKFTVAGIFAVPLVIAITWFAAHKLTWNCTLIDEQVDDPGGGLAQAIGLENDEDLAGEASRKPAKANPRPDSNSEADSGPDSKSDSQSRPKANVAPGVWVLYFGLLTLPLFGLGQLVMPKEDIASRQAAFGYLVAYVAAALGLLGTTSFLSLRRYLRQRRLTMPADMATAWPISTAVIILSVLLLCSLLPRPRPAYSLSNLIDPVSESSKKANRRSALKDNAEKSEDMQGDVPPDSDEETDQPDSENNDSAEGESDKQSDRESKNAQKQSKSSDGDSSEKSNDKSEEQSNDDSDDSGDSEKSEPSSERSKDAADAKDQETGKESNDDPGDSDESGNESQDKEPPERESPEQDGSEDQESPDEQNSNSNSKNTPPPSPPQNSISDTIRRFTPSFQGIGDILRWLYRLAFVLGLLYLFIRHASSIMAAIGRFIRDMLSLFGSRPSANVAEEEEAAATPVKIRKPFASYRNPFGGKSMSDVDLIRHSFLALEAWAHEHGVERHDGETPQEFAQRIGRKYPKLGPASHYLIQLYDRLAYRGRLPGLQVDRIQKLWQLLA